ncbi:nucleotidyltransferase [Candidatus Bariatricus faecipullorum]
MRIAGIIAEYNPFHNGHLYHMEETRRLCQADAVIAVISGDFVQRGAPALLPKRLRAQAALEAGADAILELPAIFACASAEFFAEGGVALLNALGCVDSLCFGSECGDLQLLQETARILSREPESYRQQLKQFLKEGLTFPAARQRALSVCSGSPETGRLLESPNNILGVEYLKALDRLSSSIRPVTISRRESGYHQTDLSGPCSSATAVRNLVFQEKKKDGTLSVSEKNLPRLEETLPAGSFRIITDFLSRYLPLETADFSLLLKYRLLLSSQKDLARFADVSPELAVRIWRHREEFVSWDQFCQLLKTKELTYSRISRALLHILLDIPRGHISVSKRPLCIPCARLLGFRRESAGVLKQIQEHSSIPLVGRFADTALLSPEAQKLLEKDRLASDLYQTVLAEKNHTAFQSDFRQKLVIV